MAGREIASGPHGSFRAHKPPIWSAPFSAHRRHGRLAARYLRTLCPPTVRMTVRVGHGAQPYLVSPTGAQAQAALRALEKAFRYEPVLMREGGSIAIVTEFKKTLGADTLLLGLGLPDDNPPSPNEKFSLECFSKGMSMAACLWQE